MIHWPSACCEEVGDVVGALTLNVGVEINIVIGVARDELHVVVRVHVPLVDVCDDAVVRRTLGLIALCRYRCFRRTHFP